MKYVYSANADMRCDIDDNTKYHKRAVTEIDNFTGRYFVIVRCQVKNQFGEWGNEYKSYCGFVPHEESIEQIEEVINNGIEPYKHFGYCITDPKVAIKCSA